jgi:hypothetical protein
MSPYGFNDLSAYNRSVTSTARLTGQTAFSAIRDIADALFNPGARTA